MIFFGHPVRHRSAAWLLVAAVLLAKGGTLLHGQADGSLRWPAGFSTGGLVESSPAIGPDGTIYVGVRSNSTSSTYFGSVIAIKPDGSFKWQTPQLSDWVVSSPAVSTDGSTVYVGCWNGKLYAFNAGTGVQRWEFDTHFSIANSSPAIGPDGTIYVGAGDNALHAISTSGTEIWSHPVGNVVDSSPAVGPDGAIYFGSADNNVYAVNPDNSERWRFPTGAEVFSSPAIGADGTIYIGSDDGLLYAIKSDGTKKWTFPAAGSISASPAIGPDGTIYFGSYGTSNNYFYAVNPDGTAKWQISAGLKAIFSSAAVRADGTIIFGGYDRKVYAINSADGSIKWAQLTGDIILSSPVISPSDGSVYIGSYDGKVYAFNGNGSPGSTYSSWPMFRHDAMHSGLRSAPSTGGRLVNLSTRAPAGAGANLIAGLFVNGSGSKNFLVRGVGPGLAQFQVGGFLSDPKLTLRTGDVILHEDDNWGSGGDAAQIAAVGASVGAFALSPGSKDSAFVTSLVPGPYTVVVGSVDGNAGVALVEAYDAAQSNTATGLINLSTRALAGNGEGVLTPGLVIGGGGTLRVLIRAIGPGLAGFGVPNVLAQPTINVFSGPTLVRTNTGWTSGGLKADLAAAMLAVGALPLADGSADCAMLLTLNSGAYTFQIAGVGGTTGEVLVEVYVVP